MPKAAFKDLWTHVQAGKSWMGPVKNRCKNGDYYWVNAFVTPIKDAQGKIFEYQSVRTHLNNDVKERATDVYKTMSAGKIERKVKSNKDSTLWIQLVFIMMIFLSCFSLVFSATSLAVGLPILALSLVGGIAFYSWRLKYQRLVSVAKGIVDNPLMSYVYSGNNDTIGTIEMALRMRTAELGAVVGRVSDDSAKVTSLADDSSSCGNEVEEILIKQSNETSQVATAINEMSATVKEIAEIVTRASDASKQGLDISKAGENVVSLAVAAIHELSEQLNNVDKAVERLIKGTQSIENVLAEISSIADQTNLLALNAAIEAARAGEQGRGFAVVAEEVRALAMRSQKSTEEINQLLIELREESDLVLSAMASGNTLSEKCVDLTKNTGESLNDIGSEMSDIAALNIQISVAVEQQAVVSEQISQNIVSINDMSQRSEKKARESVSLNAELLNRLSEQQSLIQQFKR
jgi:methyl-accepting chemotaxis protein